MNIELKNALRPFRRRMAAEGMIRACAAGGLFVLPLWLLAALYCRIWQRQTALLTYMPVVYLLAAVLLYALRYRPTDRALARRLDTLGQRERISTMVEFAKVDSALHRLQRADAIACLNAVAPESLRIAFSWPAVLACLLLAVMIAGVPYLPEQIVSRIPGVQRTESEEEIMLREKLEELRATVLASGLSEQDQVKLLNQIDSLYAQMQAGRMEITALQEIRSMMEQMSQTVVELTPRDTYTAALLEFERLRALGEAIFDENMDVVTLVFDNMRFQLAQKEGMEQVNALMDLVYDINASLAKPLRDNSQESLRQAMMMLSAGLETAAEMVYNKRDNAQMIETAISGAQEYIREFLGVASDEDRYDPYDEIRAQRADNPGRTVSLAPAEKAEIQLSPSETEYVYDPPEGMRRSEYSPGALREDGTVQRIPAPEDERKDGTVPYGTVYGSYYAEYLKAASSGAIPEHLTETAEAYFNGI